MSDLSPTALKWLSNHHGVITAGQLSTAGVGRATRQRLVAAGVLHCVARGVYVLASAPVTIEQRCAVLCASHPAGFVTGPTAGSMLGLRRMPRHAALHFSVPHPARFDEAPGVHLRQTTSIAAADRTARDDGVTVAAPARLAFDLAADLPELDLLSVLHQLVKEHRVSADDLIAIERRLGHRARRGSGRFKRALERLGSGRPNESHPEVVLGELLRARGVPVVNQAVVLRASTGREARIDLGVPDVRWGVELDIHPEHDTVEGRSKDARRVRDLQVADWQIEPVVEADMANAGALADELAASYHRRCRPADPHPRAG